MADDEEVVEISATPIAPWINMVVQGRKTDGKIKLRFYLQWTNQDELHEVTREEAELLVRLRELATP